ncbi:MAG: diacylglycerol kinase family lipid kinase [bacterium]
MNNYSTYFVVNPHSANRRTGRLWPEIKALAEKHLGTIGFGLTEEQGHAVELTREAIKSGYEMITSLGGDGTNNEVVNGFFEDGKTINPEAVLGVVCSGTGSDLIRTAGIPRDFQSSVPMLEGRDARPTDVGYMRFRDHQGNQVGRYFINIASFGVAGEVDERVNNTSKLLGGKISFLWASLRGTLAYRNKTVRLSLDEGEQMTRRVFNVAVANGQYFGAGMRTAPKAVMDDGLFDVAILGDFSFREELKLMRRIYDGSHMNMDKVESFRAKKVVAESEERVLLDVDGEQPGMLPASFEILPAAIKMKRP